MNVLLIGYGQMGKQIEKVLLDRKHTISSIIDLNETSKLSDLNPKEYDVAIEFTSPKSAFSNITYCLNNNIPIVSGTTGWESKKKEAENLCIKNNTSCVFASNFSLGVNVLFALNKKLANILSNNTEFKPQIEETHHIRKKDKPSGTAITLAKQITKINKNYTNFELDTTDKNTINIKSNRIGDVFGDHEIKYESTSDILSLKHSAKSREGFALGAVIAAEYIHNKKGIFTMDNILNL